VILILQGAHMSKTRLISTLTTGLAVLVAACWLVTGTFPLTAEPQVVSDAAGVTVNLNGSTVLHRTTVHYPAAALQRGEQGSVTVEVKLDASGNVSDARVLSGPDDLRSAVLESVLEWHFTRDAAGGTRMVEVGFELPTKGVVEGVSGGVQGGIVGGVQSGIVSGVPGGVVGGVPGGVVGRVGPGVPADLRIAPEQSRILSIQVAGLSDESSAALLASLPVHEGDKLTEDALRRTNQAVQAFDEHLTLRASFQSSDGVYLRIIAPGVAPPPPPPPPPSAQAALQNPPEKIKVGGNVQSAMIVTKVPPLYPALAKMAGVQGAVRLAVIIGKDGTVQEIHVLDGPPLLVQAAMDAVKQWVYKPTFLNGDPVAVETTIDVNFTLSQ
jgi:protein TonB